MMDIKLQEYNPADLLKSEEDITSYLNDAYDDDDPATFVIALGDVAKMKGIGYVAKKAGLNRESLCKALSGKTRPPWDTIQRVMKSLNIHIQAVAQ